MEEWEEDRRLVNLSRVQRRLLITWILPWDPEDDEAKQCRIDLLMRLGLRGDGPVEGVPENPQGN